MGWTSSLPAKPGFYWAMTQTETITIFKADNGIVTGFGAETIPQEKIRLWGQEIEAHDNGFSSALPEEDAWYAGKTLAGTVSPIRVAKGSVLHCYDFESVEEINLKNIGSWNGPLRVPAPPPK